MRAGTALLVALATLASVVASAEPLRVVTTIQPLGLVVRELGGERVVVSVLVPPGASPHTFEPQPSDVQSLVAARLIVEVGGGLDGWVHPLLAAAAARPDRLTLLDLPGLDPLPAAADSHVDTGPRDAAHRLDPHAWLDPIRVRDVLVPALATKLAALDAAGSVDYQASRENFVARLTALDAEIRTTLAGHGRQFLAFHAAWRYFAKRYDLEEVGVIEEAPGEEPTPRELGALAQRAREARLPAILIEPQLSSRIAEMLARDLGAAVVTVDPNGDPTDPERASYEGLMRWNARAFARALGGAAR
jgi:ABC-type Zn uptake system ZnuABC Zn-binding protein ZnuA